MGTDEDEDEGEDEDEDVGSSGFGSSDDRHRNISRQEAQTRRDTQKTQTGATHIHTEGASG